jgi:haloacetate dehalogenase
MCSMFSGFESSHVDVGETTIFIQRKGHGPPLLLLHGFPQTHAMWHRVAPALTEEFTVVCADLRGYGASGKPASRPDHSPYAKRALALDLVKTMQAQGLGRFCVAGHDRGGRVAYRLALDHPDRVRRLAVLDLIPTGEAFRRADMRFALGFWPWSLLSQPAPLPERLLAADPALLIDYVLDTWGRSPEAFPPEVRAAYARALTPAAIHAICEEFRAAATLDFEHDEADRVARRRITCPVLALWSRSGPVDTWYDALAIWRAWADDVRGRPIDGGHFLPEEAPDETVAELLTFFRE